MTKVQVLYKIFIKLSPPYSILFPSTYIYWYVLYWYSVITKNSHCNCGVTRQCFAGCELKHYLRISCNPAFISGSSAWLSLTTSPSLRWSDLRFFGLMSAAILHLIFKNQHCSQKFSNGTSYLSAFVSGPSSCAGCQQLLFPGPLQQQWRRW